MNKFFTENLPWKVTSVVLAFVLWLFVINTQNPIQPQEIVGVNMVIAGLNELEEMGYELSNEEEIRKQQFRVVVTGPRLEIDKLIKDPDLITVTINMADYIDDLNGKSLTDTANYSIKLNIDSYAVSVTDKKPQVTKVNIEKIEQKVQRVNYELATSLTDAYTLIDDEVPGLTPNKVTITGPKTDIDRVSEAKVYIEGKDFSEEKLVANLPVKLYDAEGTEITTLSISPEVVEVKLPIGKEKEVPVKLSYIGELKEGLVLVNTILSPENVRIIGKADILNEIKEIELVPINLSKIDKTSLIEVGMKLPDGVMTLMDSNVSVSIEVMEEESLKYPIQTSDMNLEVIGVGDNLSYEILTPMIEVTLSALPNKLLNYDVEDIHFILDLTGYVEGKYTLPLVAKTPEDIRVLDEVINVDIKIKETEQIEPLPTEIPEASPEPTVIPTPN